MPLEPYCTVIPEVPVLGEWKHCPYGTVIPEVSLMGILKHRPLGFWNKNISFITVNSIPIECQLLVYNWALVGMELLALWDPVIKQSENYVFSDYLSNTVRGTSSRRMEMVNSESGVSRENKFNPLPHPIYLPPLYQQICPKSYLWQCWRSLINSWWRRMPLSNEFPKGLVCYLGVSWKRMAESQLQAEVSLKDSGTGKLSQ